MIVKLSFIAVGQVSLQRHRSLERVWQVLPSADNNNITGLAWRPDSNLIAIGYQTGESKFIYLLLMIYGSLWILIN